MKGVAAKWMNFMVISNFVVASLGLRRHFINSTTTMTKYHKIELENDEHQSIAYWDSENIKFSPRGRFLVVRFQE
jgi:hypothetical protein